MQDKQPEAFGYAYCLESRGFEAEATLLRTQHAAIERKDALLRQALDALNLHQGAHPETYRQARDAITKELAK